MKLISDWRQAWRLWSVRATAIGAVVTATAAASPDALLTAWNALPDELRTLVPEDVDRWVAPLLFAVSLAVRILRQRSARDGK
jgi:hypothetical protein